MASSARLDELRKKFEENPRRYFAPLANEYRKAGETEQAIAICREYLPQQPGHMSGHIVFGQALYEARQFEEAKTVFETALSLDPENLIALRHLGDIALILGDSDGARGWYRRVLDADPRNEEIQAQLASLDKAASGAPTPAVTPAQDISSPSPTPVAAAKPTPSSAPTVVVSAMKPPSATGAPAPRPAPVTATSQTAEVRLEDIVPTHAEPSPSMSSASTIEVENTAVPQTEPHGGSPPPHGTVEGLESHAASADAPPLDSFSLDGLETTSLSASGAPSPAAALPPAESLPDLDLGPVSSSASSPAESLTAEPPQPASEAGAVSEELQPLDLDLGTVANPVQPDAGTGLDVREAVPEAQAPESPELVFIAPDEQPVAAAPEPVADLQFEEPSAAAPAQPAESGPFVTETMAELYLQQGHREEALKVYRALMEQRPGDAALAARVRVLETGGTPAESGERFGDLLRMIAARRPGHRAERAEDSGAASHAAPAPRDEASPPPALDVDDTAVAPAPAPTGVSAEGNGQADRLALALGFAAPDGRSEAAATTLAVAFARNGAAALHGAPARPASTELSLDSVFGSPQRASGPPAPPPSSFSFDQFFSNKDGANAGTAGGGSESAQEVAQFTQWLEGLKRR